jgi:hypothetical protein
MDAPPPLPPAAAPIPETPPPGPPPAFKLPLAAWIAVGLYAALKVTLFVIRPGPASPYATGELIGEIVAMFLFPTIVALLVWRLAGRTKEAGTYTFFGVFALAVLGQFAQFARRAQAGGELRQIAAESRRIQAEQRTTLDQKGTMDDRQSVALAERASDQLGKLAETSVGHQRDLATASKAYMDHMLAVKRRYDDAIANLGGEDFWKLASLADPEALAARRQTVRAFMQANEQLSALQDEAGTAFRRELTTRGANERDIADAMASYKKSAGPRLPWLVKIRETDAQIGQAMLDFLDFAEANRGKWHKNESDGKIVFDATDAPATYREILARVNEASTAQAEYQKQLLTPKK